MENKPNPIIAKILGAENDTFIIFFVYGCPYCERALQFLRSHNLKYKSYDINSINGEMPRLLNILNYYKDQIGFNPNHRTKPIIFLNGRFVGGYNELLQLNDNFFSQ